MTTDAVNSGTFIDAKRQLGYEGQIGRGDLIHNIDVPHGSSMGGKRRSNSESPNSIAYRSRSPPICIPVKRKKRQPSPAFKLHEKLRQRKKKSPPSRPKLKPHCAKNLEVINFACQEEAETIDDDPDDMFMFEL